MDTDKKAVKQLQWSGGAAVHDDYVKDVGLFSRLFFAFDDMGQMSNGLSIAKISGKMDQTSAL